MQLNTSTDNTELSKIIKSLISFIVIDSKDFIKEEAQEAYIKKYIYTLTKSMNGANNFVNVNTLWKAVKNDIKLISHNSTQDTSN